MFISIDPASNVTTILHDAHRNITAGMRRALGEPSVCAGDRLPTAKEVAEGLGINMHTVLKAYAALRDEGLIEMRRGRGVTVSRQGNRASVVEAARVFILEAQRHGLTLQERLNLIEELS